MVSFAIGLQSGGKGKVKVSNKVKQLTRFKELLFYWKRDDMKVAKFLTTAIVLISIIGCATTGQFRYQMGHQSFAAGNIASAISDYEQAFKAEPQNTFYAGNLVIAYLINGQKDKAMQLSQQVMKDFPDDGFAYVSSGIAKLGSKEYREAINLMIKGIDVNKKNPKEYSNNLERTAPLWLGVAYLLNNNFDEAKGVFEDNLKQPFADKIMDYTGLIVANYKLSNSEEVFNNIIHVFEISGWTAESASKIAKNPKNLEPKKANIENISKVIVLHMYLKEYDKAKDLAQSLVKADEYAGALMMGLVQIGQLKRDDAIDNFKIAAKQKPYCLMAIWLLAMDNATTGDFDAFMKNLYSVTTIASTPQRDYWQEAQQISNTLAISRYISSKW